MVEIQIFPLDEAQLKIYKVIVMEIYSTNFDSGKKPTKITLSAQLQEKIHKISEGLPTVHMRNRDYFKSQKDSISPPNAPGFLHFLRNASPVQQEDNSLVSRICFGFQYCCSGRSGKHLMCYEGKTHQNLGREKFIETDWKWKL